MENLKVKRSVVNENSNLQVTRQFLLQVYDLLNLLLTAHCPMWHCRLMELFLTRMMKQTALAVVAHARIAITQD